MKLQRLFTFLIALFIVSGTMADRPKIGLVLGGGGAKGAAEVGVLKVIEQAGVPIDYIAGSSVGAIVGGLYAAGYTADELETIFQTQEWLSLLTDRNAAFSDEPYRTQDGVTYIFGFPVMDRNSRGFGMMRGGRIEQLLDSMVSVRGCTEFESLRIPFCCVAADMRTAQEVVLSKGIVASAIRASIAIPGIFKPVSKDDYMLVDGGLLNNLPVDVCKAMGADIIIAIDLQQEERQPRQQTESSLLTSLGDFLGLGGVIEWLINRPDIRKHSENRKLVDIYIRPDIPDYDMTSFGNKNSARMIRAGEEAAKHHWEELLKLTPNYTPGIPGMSSQ